jgi:hypothetical protein
MNPRLFPGRRHLVAACCALAAMLAPRAAAAQMDPRCAAMTLPAGADLPAADTAQSADSVFTIAQVDTVPTLTNARLVLQQLSQSYLRGRPAEGVAECAVLLVRVDADGTVHRRSERVLYATDRGFGNSAANVARTMKFRPAMRGGRPVAVWFTVPLSLSVPP